VLKDLDKVKQRKEAVEKMVTRNIDKSKKNDLVTLEKVLKLLEEKQDVRSGTWDNKDIEVLNEMALLTAKPVVYLVNIGEKSFEGGKSKWLKPIKDWVAKRSPGAPTIPFSAAFEKKLSTLSDEDRKKYLEEKKVPSMLNKIITTGYDALSCIHFFTCGPDEVRAWTVRRGALAPQAAGVIHTDFEKGFICAETMAFEDFKKYGTEAACKAAGKYRSEGKGYLVKDGDIFYFKSGEGKKKK